MNHGEHGEEVELGGPSKSTSHRFVACFECQFLSLPCVTNNPNPRTARRFDEGLVPNESRKHESSKTRKRSQFFASSCLPCFYFVFSNFRAFVIGIWLRLGRAVFPVPAWFTLPRD